VGETAGKRRKAGEGKEPAAGGAEPMRAEEPEARAAEMRTVIDRVVDFIRERRRATVGEVAEALAIDRESVEKLADILEESGLIAVRYSLLHPGKTELIMRERAQPAAAKKEAGVAEMVAGLDNDVRTSEKLFLSVEDDILTRLRRAEEALEAIEQVEKGASPEEVRGLIMEGEAIDGLLLDFDKKVDVLERRIENFRRRVALFKARSAAIGRRGPLARLLGFIERIVRVITRRAFGRG